MPQSFSQVLLHVVFSTKHRTGWLQDKAVRDSLCAYIAGTLKDIDCPAIVINGVEDHLHILCAMSRTITIAKLVEEAKTESSKWVKKQGATYAEFHWQSGYGAFSVSQSNKPALVEYIRNQEEHHKTMSFQDEFRKLLEKHGLQWDERYVWD
jgi:REP element-mobilizing transposase RayT